MIGVELNEENFIHLKQGLDKLEEYFGMSNLQNYFASKNSKNDNNINIDSSIIGNRINIGICILFYLFNFVFSKRNETILNENAIQKFFETMETTLNDDEVFNKKNLFIIAIEKTKDNDVNEICMFPHHIDGLNGNVCPTIGEESPGTNERYYYYLLKGIHFYKKKYQEMKDGYLSDEWKKDYNFLRTATIEQIMEVVEEKKEDTDAEKTGHNPQNNLGNTHNGVTANHQNLNFQNIYNGVTVNQQNFNFPNRSNGVIANLQDLIFLNEHDAVIHLDNSNSKKCIPG